MYCIILTRSENTHSDIVEKGLEGHGVHVLRFNVDDINTEPPKICFTNDEQYVLFKGEKISMEQIFSIFVHHPRIDISDEVFADSVERKIISATWTNALMSLEQILDDKLWINKISSSRSSLNVLRQLSIATELGLQVPETCFTNDTESLFNFASGKDRLIAKSGPLLGVRFERQRLLTKVLGVDEIPSLNIQSAPCFFQEYIEKAYELRVHVIGNKVLACRIESQQSDISKEDWRRYDIANTPHYAHELSSDIESKCIQITQALGLNLGIIDMIVTLEGEHIFLECNSQGHWIWIEELTGLEITKAMVELLSPT